MEEVLIFLCLVHISLPQSGLDAPTKPEKCDRPAEFLYRQCCVFPPFFVRDVAKECGAMFELSFNDERYNVTGFQRVSGSYCDYWKCLLKRYGFVNEDTTTLNDEKYYAHLDKWVDYNPEFGNVMQNAKMHCKNYYRLFLPIDLCDFFKFQMCIRNYINTDCPATIPTHECIEKKKFYDECREYYV